MPLYILNSTRLDLNTRTDLLFSLVAEQISIFYEHGVWMTDKQGASLAGQWLRDKKWTLPPGELMVISALADQLVRQLTASLSREAGLYAVHEMTEARDPQYQSSFALDMRSECERMLVESDMA